MILNYCTPKHIDVLWAKKSDKDGIFQWLPLKEHLIDVIEVIRLLWEHWLSENQRQIIINSLSKPNSEVAKNLIGFLAGTHDIGKATPVFHKGSIKYLSRIRGGDPKLSKWSRFQG